jgi:hypothetical protein
VNEHAKKVRQNRVKKLYITLLGVDGFSIFVLFWAFTFKWLKMSTGQFVGSLGFLIALGAVLIWLMRKEPNFYEELLPPKGPATLETKEPEATTVADSQ